MRNVTKQTVITIVGQPVDKSILREHFKDSEMVHGFDSPAFKTKSVQSKFKYLVINPVGNIISYSKEIHGIQMTWDDYMIHTNK